MRILRSSIIIILVFGLVLTSFSAVADTITDNTNDVFHWYWNAETSTFNWQAVSEEKPNIDITSLTFGITGDIATFTMTVAGEFVDSEYTMYWATYTSDDDITYYFSYTNGAAFGIATSTSGGSFDMEPDYTIAGNTLTVNFDSVGLGTENIELHGYAYTSLAVGDTSGEAWWDYAPDSFAPYFGQVGGDGDGDDGDGGTTTPPAGTPGFEMLAVIGAIAIAFIILKRKK